MKAKTRISITIDPSLNHMLDNISKISDQSKSSLVEKAIKDLLYKKMEEDAKALGKMVADDLPTEDEWLVLMPKID